MGLHDLLLTSGAALPGHSTPMTVRNKHYVLGHPILPPFPDGMEVATFAMGCFWGVERLFWQLDGVWTTAVGYAGGETQNPTYEEVCSGRTGHAEAVRIVFDPAKITYESLLAAFWESHDPTQGMRQGNDIGSQYRSVIFAANAAQEKAARASAATYGEALAAQGRGAITTAIVAAPAFYYAEDYHQQYLAKNPGGYCGLKGTGVACPVAV